MTDESVTAAMLQSQANQHEEVLAAALAHAEEQGKTISALRAELEEASAKLKVSREEFDIVLRTSTAEKKALESKMGTIEAECAALKAAASSVPGAPAAPTPPTPSTPPTPPDTLDTGLSIADILHLSSPLRPAQALPLPPPVLHPVLLPPPLLMLPLSQVLQLLRLPLLTAALREHRRARRARTRP